MATSELSAKQHKAIVALLSEPTIKAAAESIGVGERTLHTWLDDPAFNTAYRVARREAVGQAIARLQQASPEMVTELVAIAKDITKSAAVRVSAASKVLDLAIKAVELEDITARLEALEAHYAAQQSPEHTQR